MPRVTKKPKAKRKPRAAAVTVEAPAPKAKKPPIPGNVAATFLPPWKTGVAGPVLGAKEDDPDSLYDFRHVHPRTQAVRRAFVAEFCKDFNGVAALARLGFVYETPAVTANLWLKEPFTQYVLDKYLTEAKDEAFVTRGKVIAGLVREANGYGGDCSGASRVSALRSLGKILGLEITKAEVSVTTPGGVILVPIGGTPEDWERNAASAQANLKANA